MAECWHKQVYQAIIIILDQMAVLKRKYSRPKNLVQMSSSAIMKHLYGKKGSTDIKMDAKQLPRELYFLSGLEEVAEEELQEDPL